MLKTLYLQGLATFFTGFFVSFTDFTVAFTGACLTGTFFAHLAMTEPPCWSSNANQNPNTLQSKSPPKTALLRKWYTPLQKPNHATLDKNTTSNHTHQQNHTTSAFNPLSFNRFNRTAEANQPHHTASVEPEDQPHRFSRTAEPCQLQSKHTHQFSPVQTNP